MAELMRKEKANVKQNVPKPRLGEPIESSRLDKELINLLDRFRMSNNQEFWAKARELVEMGADPDTRDSGFDPILIHAAAYGETEMCRLLLEKGAMVNLREENGRTALMFAAKKNHHEICELLIEKGASVNATDKHGMTALHFAAIANSAWICRILLESGADQWAVNPGEKDTAMDWAKAHESMEAYYFLEEWPLRKSIGIEEAKEFVANFRECVKNG
jgi:ankyrin repeat protein